MPFPTVYPGQVITAAWGNIVRNQMLTPWASAAARTSDLSAIGTIPAGLASILTDYMDLWIYDGSDHKVFAGPPIAVKPADETVNDTAVYQDDGDLYISVAANAVYKVYLHLSFSTYAAHSEGLRVRFTIPAGASILGGWYETIVGAAVSEGVTLTNGEVTGIIPAGDPSSDVPYISRFILKTGATAGTLQLQWAQNVDWANDLTVAAGSILSARRVV